ncbi:multidrug effflux MFS transporter [Primorskyibacter flagellatus]|uniref:multidrug effflux MFS transporter n=1 Tax=Primorskyibacter flagellatus TaxID=1387277 RepID=UPI003A8F1DAD
MSLFRAALVLGLLSAVGPFAIDMFLPAMPAIAADLAVSETATQATITAFFISFGLAQLIYGPWSDQVGRKLPLYVGLTIFSLASIGCAMADSIVALTALRFVQGIGASVVMVVPRAVIRDMLTGNAATRLMALVMLVISVSPMLAPLAGSIVLAFAEWRVIFWVLAGGAVLSLALTAALQPETLPVEKRVPINLASLWRGAGILLRDRTFLGMTFIGGFGMASFFVFIASAPFVYSGQYGLTPTGFSIAFAVNAVGFFGASQLAARLGEQLGPEKVIRRAVMGFATFTTLLLVLTLSGFASLYVLIGCLFLGNACLGLVIPTTMVLALDPHGEIAGLASSLGGTMQMLAGGAMIALVGPFFDGTALPMVVAIAICAWVAFGLSRLLVSEQAAVA